MTVLRLPLHRIHTALLRVLLVFLFLAAAPFLRASAFQWELEVVNLDGVAANLNEARENNLMWSIYGKGAKGSSAGTTPATTTVIIPADGVYYIWAEFQISSVRRKSFWISLNDDGQLFCPLPYGESEEGRPEVYRDTQPDDDGFIWTRHSTSLTAGSYALKLTAKPEPGWEMPTGGGHPPFVRQIVITSNADFRP